MSIFNLYVPVVTDKHHESLEFYKRLWQEEPKFDLVSDGLHFSLVSKTLILSRIPDGGPAIPFELVSRVRGIFTVNDLDVCLELLRTENAEIVFGPMKVSTGRNCYVRHPDGHIFEYLELQR
jgi:hypothetical protein